MSGSSDVFIGLDCGTGGARALICGVDGKLLAVASKDYPTRFPQPGRAEQTPEGWWQAACLAVREAVAEAGVSPASVRAICADGTSSTLVALDENLSPIGEAILWMDNRASPQAHQIQASGHPALRRSRGGVSAETALPKILWIKQQEPERYARTRWFVEMADYMALRLSGQLTLGLNHTINRWFYDPRQGGWPLSLFEAVGLEGIESRFPPWMLPFGAPISPLSAEAAEALGLTTSTLTVCGGTDAYVAMAGLNTLRDGETALITGTSHLVLPMTDADTEVEGIFGPHPDCVVPDLFVMEGGQVSSGGILRWWQEVAFGREKSDFERMMREAEEVPLGANGLIALDFWQGNRNPYIDYDLQGAVWGLTMKHGAADITRALMESVVLGTANIIERLTANGISIGSMTVAGGCLRTPYWLQMHADATNLTLRIPEVGDATALGAAIGASVGAGAYDSLQSAARQMVRINREIRPDPSRHAAYRDLLALYRETHEALRPLMHRMAERTRTMRPDTLGP